jgi:carbon monoxide dehydrogenase subunit G
MGSVQKELTINAKPEDVWDAVRDFGALDTRMVRGFVTGTWMDGTDRIVTFSNGAVQREPLVDLDDGTRRLVYSAVDSPMGATHYNASVQVFSNGKGTTRLVWLVDFLPNELMSMMGAVMERGAEAMKETLENPS